MELTPNMGGNRIMVALSATSDPLGTWFRYIVYTAPSGKCVDQPKLGYSADKIVVTSSLFNAVCARGTAPFDSARMLVLDAVALRAGNPVTFDEFDMGGRFGLLPALPTRQAEMLGSTSNAFAVFHGSDILNSDIAALVVIRGNPAASNVQFQQQS